MKKQRNLLVKSSPTADGARVGPGSSQEPIITFLFFFRKFAS